MKSNLLLVLLSLLLPFELATAKPKFTEVPPSCERLLTKFAKTNGEKSVHEEIDWLAIRENMVTLGYSENIVDKKLKEVTWDEEATRTKIEEITGVLGWTWKRGLNDEIVAELGRKEGSNYYSEQFLAALPILASFRGMDIPLLINNFLKVKDNLDEDNQKLLSFYAPLWLKGPKALENAKLFYKKVQDGEQNVVSKWLSWNLPDRIKPRFLSYLQQRIRADFGKTYGEDDAWDDLKVTAALPWAKMPANIKRYLVNTWVELEKYPPITLDSIHHITSGYHYAGNCEYMANGHMKSLGLAHRQDCSPDFNDTDGYKSSVLIEVNGQLVGSLKRLGDHSMIALRNVFDSSGRLVLAMGGVYHLGQGIYDSLPSKSRNGRWPRVNLNQLLVHPHTYMLNDNGWQGDINTGLLLRVGLDEYTKEDLVAMFDTDRGNYHSVSLDDEKRTPIWDAILAKIDAVRKSLER